MSNELKNIDDLKEFLACETGESLSLALYSWFWRGHSQKVLAYLFSENEYFTEGLLEDVLKAMEIDRAEAVWEHIVDEGLEAEFERFMAEMVGGEGGVGGAAGSALP